MRLFLGMIFAASASIAVAEPLISVGIEGIDYDNGRVYLLVKANNHSEHFLDRIMFDCTLFSEDGSAVDLQKGRVRTLAAGESGFDKVPFIDRGNATKAQCRITDVLP